MTTNNTTPNFPPHLIEGFKRLADDFEMHIRADERKRLLAKFREAFPATGNQTDMHGEPLQGGFVQRVELNDTHREMIRWLSTGTFMAVPTLAGHLNIRKGSVYTYMTALRKAGYQIEKRSTGNHKGGYRDIFRLAKTG
tara:strand:+ start:116 stop:532 length:417 start_codon:yes stop_codon:yes gene_type:complete